MATPRALLREFVRDCEARFPMQYTPEWFSNADGSIGGSDMARLMESEFSVLAHKMGASAQASAQASAPERTTISDDGVAQPRIAARPRTRQRAPIAPRPGASMSDITIISDAGAAPAPDITIIPDAPAPSRDARTDAAVPMGWGTLFEPLLCNYIARTTELEIDGRAVSYFEEPFRFSPDGLFVDKEGRAALLEMKNPYSRVWPTWKDDAQACACANPLVEPHKLSAHPEEVPPQYIGQLQLGLHLIPFLSYAYYVEAIYRRANGYRYPCAIKVQRMVGVRNARAIESGVIGFYHPTGQGDLARAIDFSSRENDDLLCNVLTHLRDGENSFIPAYFEQDDDQRSLPFARAEQLPLSFSGRPLYGFMPWHLLGLHCARVERDEAMFSDSVLRDRAQAIAPILRAFKDASEEEKEAMRAHLRAQMCAQKTGALTSASVSPAPALASSAPAN